MLSEPAGARGRFVMAMAARGSPRSPPEPGVCEIVLPMIVFELSDDEFLGSEYEEQTASEENLFCLKIEKDSRGAEGVRQDRLSEGVPRAKNTEEQATPVKVTNNEGCDGEVPDTCEGLNGVSFQNAVDHSEPEENKVLGFLDPKSQDRIEKWDGKTCDFGGDHRSDQRTLASLITQNKGESNVTDSVMKMGATVSLAADPAANGFVQESLPELPSVDPGGSVAYEGTGPLETGYNDTSKNPRRSSELNEETCQSNKLEEYPNVADQNERNAPPFINGNGLPGDFPEDAGSLMRDDHTNPESDVAGNLVPPETAGCQDRQAAQENTNSSNENAESDQRLPMRNLKEAPLPRDKPSNGTSRTSTKKHAKTKDGWKCLLCQFEGTSSAHLKKHFHTVHKTKNNHNGIQRSSSVSSERCRGVKKKRKALKKGKKGRNKPGENRRDKDKPAAEKKGKKYDKFFSKTKILEPSESFCCEKCSLVFSDPKDFSQHVKEHNIGPPYPCPQCEYASYNHSYFLNHLCWHAGHELYKCKFCTFLSRHHASMVMHRNLHTGAKPYSCAVCQLGFTSASGLSKHRDTHCGEQKNGSLHVARGKEARPPKTYLCDECDIVFYTQALLQSHKKCHAQEKGHDAPSVNVKKCKTRGTEYGRVDGSREGGTNSPNNSVGGKSDCFPCMYSCDRCSLAFHKEEHLVYHQAVHGQIQPGENVNCNDRQSRGDTGVPEIQPAARPALKRFKCLQCAYMTSDFSNLRIHFATHTGDRPFKCQECGKTFRNSSHLKRHGLLHVHNRHRCSGCRFIASSAEDLKLHEGTCKDKTPGGKRLLPSALSCKSTGEETGRGKANESALSQGSGARSYKCEHCDYSSYSLDNLKTHTRIHTGEKPYACDVCQKKFRTSSHLRRHALVHQKLNFKCRSCDCSASTWQSLKQHMASHGETHLPRGSQSPTKSPSPVKIYKCEKCSYSTVKKENLKVHFRIHTGERPYKCPHCSYAFRTSSHLKKHSLTHLRLQCGQCEFSTLDERALQKHARAHKKKECSIDQENSTKKTVYKCNKCRRTFSMLRIFKAHKKKHRESNQ